MTFKEELQESMRQAQTARDAARDPYNRLLAQVKRLCRDEAQRGKTRREERLTTATLKPGTDDDYTLMPDDPDLKEQYLARLRADLPGLDVNLFFGGVYLDVSWE